MVSEDRAPISGRFPPVSGRYEWMKSRLATSVCVVLAGCATAQRAPDPAPTLEAYAAAVRAGDAAALHALLDEETRATVDEARLAELLTENQAELREQLDSVPTQRLETRAVVELPTGDAAVLSLEDQQWRIDGGLLGTPALLTPVDAVRALRRALLRRGLSDVLAVFGRSLRGEVEAEVQRFLEETADELDYDTEIQGHAATVRTSGGRVVRLTREAGEWRVVDFE